MKKIKSVIVQMPDMNFYLELCIYFFNYNFKKIIANLLCNFS